MRVEPLAMAGAALIRIERHADERGFFARTFCAREFSAAGLPSEAVQSSISFNERAGTVRGMHFQWPPSQEGKLVRCIRGKLHDVLLDLRPQSASYLQHVALQLDEDNCDAVFIPPGVAHGFQTLVDRTVALYQMTDYFVSGVSTGVRWNDPAFGIEWPVTLSAISERDANCVAFEREQFEAELAGRKKARAS